MQVWRQLRNAATQGSLSRLPVLNQDGAEGAGDPGDAGGALPSSTTTTVSTLCSWDKVQLGSQRDRSEALALFGKAWECHSAGRAGDFEPAAVSQ